MSRRLTEYLNSSYIGAASRMKPAGARRRIVAYVEGYDDILFWRNVLGRFEDGRIYFEVMLPSRTSLAKGKKVAITNILGNALGENMIACVDADYDYLLQGAREASRIVCGNPYVFHTYAYAIENFQCYAPLLRRACVAATLNDREVFDFERFMGDFSETAYPAFVWNVWCYRSGNHSAFSMSSLCGVIALRDISLRRPERSLEQLRRRVARTVAWLRKRFPQAKREYAPLTEELGRLGVTPANAYMYMRGHDIFGAVVCPLVGAACETLRNERESEVRRLAADGRQMQNELAGYRHCVISPETVLRKQTGFEEIPQYRQILASLQGFVSRLAAEKYGEGAAGIPAGKPGEAGSAPAAAPHAPAP